MIARRALPPRAGASGDDADSLGSTVLGQHRCLQRLLEDVEAILLTVVPSRIPLALSARLGDLELALDAHFAHEEREGLFEEMAAQAPETTAAVAALLAEHGRIRRRVGALHLRALRAECGATLATAVRRLLRDVARHERRENELLLATLDTSVAAQD